MASQEIHILTELISSDLRTGAANDSLDLASLGRPLGLRFTFCGRIDKQMEEEAARRGVGIVRGRSRFLSKWSVVPYGINVCLWIARLKQLRPDIVHLDYAGWAPSLACAAHMLGLPVVGRAGGRYHHSNLANRWIQAYVANCLPHAATLLESPLASKVVVTGSLFRVDRLNPPFALAAPIPARPDQRSVRFLFLGQLVERKGVDTLVQAFAKVRADSDLLLVGGAWEEPGFPARIRQMIQQSGVAERIVTQNHRPDAPALLNDCDVFVLPSRSDARPRTVIEAMYLGKPVVASNVGGIPTLIEHGATGMLVPPSDPDSLGTVLEQLASDAALRQRLGTAAAGWARAEVQPERAAQLHAELYRRLAGNRAGIPPSSPRGAGGG